MGRQQSSRKADFMVHFYYQYDICTGLGGVMHCFAMGENLAGAGHLLFGAFYMCWFLDWKDRLRFPITMVEQTMDIVNRFGHAFRIAAAGRAVAVGFMVWFAITFVAVFIRYMPDSNNPAFGGSQQRAMFHSWTHLDVVPGGHWISEAIESSIHVSFRW
ncbi:hypothetical protein C7212DRAFT_365536 [Tuber magnatum]|uniref:Protein PNS1 n=1 Tax=Tuber magnatum TaxID=42249 RepID=A0A317SKB1_9PEZI|nr:hypothetical protein C7212DRAFT_365536 [Tuber magnatum]